MPRSRHDPPQRPPAPARDQLPPHEPQHARLLLLAQAMLSRTPEDRLRWILDFLPVDLTKLDAEAKLTLSISLRVIPFLGTSEYLIGGDPQLGLEPAALPDTALRRLQADLTAGFRRLLSADAAWALPAPETAVLFRPSPLGAKPAHFSLSWVVDNDRTRILLAIASHVREHGQRLKACARCDTPLLAIKRQIYCTPACAQKARDEKKAAATHPTRTRSRTR